MIVFNRLYTSSVYSISSLWNFSKIFKNLKYKDIIEKNTIIPICLNSLQASIYDNESSNYISRIYVQYKRNYPESFLYLKYCPHCFNEQMKLYGEKYWRREWQLYFVQVCFKHHTPLIVTPFFLYPGHLIFMILRILTKNNAMKCIPLSMLIFLLMLEQSF